VYVQCAVRTSLTRCLAYVSSCFLTGCGSVNFAPRGVGSHSTLSLSTVNLDEVATHVESDLNNLFEQAEPIALSGEPVVIRGSIESGDDVDIYDLGAVTPGDRIVVEMEVDETLDGAIALFDDSASSVLINDHRNVYLGERKPFIDVVMRYGSDNCYVAVSATPGYRDSGAYTLLATKQTEAQIPPPKANTVLLVFNGAQSVRIGSRPVIDVPPFDAADISDTYDGLTDVIVADIVEHVRNDFDGFDITILSTTEGAAFESDMSRLFFGTYDDALLGVAEGVDEFNGDQQQEAIVFTDTFRAFARIGPSARELAQAMANVSSHEIGHLLGLVHTEDPAGVMDVTASLSELLRDQTFTKSPIYDLVFPVGLQDAVLYLVEAVGGDVDTVLAKEAESLQTRSVLPAPAKGEPARSAHLLSLCGLECRDTRHSNADKLGPTAAGAP